VEEDEDIDKEPYRWFYWGFCGAYMHMARLQCYIDFGYAAQHPGLFLRIRVANWPTSVERIQTSTDPRSAFTKSEYDSETIFEQVLQNTRMCIFFLQITNLAILRNAQFS
jgi:hypothetical protein